MDVDTCFDHITELPTGLVPRKTPVWSPPRPPDHVLDGETLCCQTSYSDGTTIETAIVVPCGDWRRLYEIGALPESTNVLSAMHAIGRCKVLREHYTETIKYSVVCRMTPEELLGSEENNEGEEWKTP